MLIAALQVDVFSSCYKAIICLEAGIDGHETHCATTSCSTTTTRHGANLFCESSRT